MISFIWLSSIDKTIEKGSVDSGHGGREGCGFQEGVRGSFWYNWIGLYPDWGRGGINQNKIKIKTCIKLHRTIPQWKKKTTLLNNNVGNKLF